MTVRVRNIWALLILAVGLAAACGGSDRRGGLPGEDAGAGDAGSADSGSATEETLCADGADDDSDGLVDCADPDCADDAACVDEECGNGSLDFGEECDVGERNGDAASCCTAGCSLRAAGEVCRAGSGDVCDPEETCDGSSGECPADVVSPDTSVCRLATDDECDPAETCTGVPGEPCPSDEVVSDGTPCTGNGESECSGPDTCLSGVCDDGDLAAGTACGAGTAQPTCDPDVCDGAGSCTDVAALADGAACTEDGGDTCCGGACVAGAPSAGTCDPCALPPLGSATVTIIESQSTNSAHDMDAEWEAVATGMGLSATIVSQSVLDDPSMLATTDILILASGVAPISATRVTALVDFVAGGGALYLQAEYQTTYDSNGAFVQAVAALGGAFTWASTVTGSLTPTVSGCLASEPEVVTDLTYFWYGATGSGSGLDVFLTEGSTPVGWTVCGAAAGAGYLISTTDQDWVKNSDSNPEARTLMRNILHRLAVPSAC